MYWHARREPLPPGTKLSRDVVRRVWGFARDFRWQIAGYLFLLALSSLAAVVPALLVRELLNTAIPQRSFSLVNLIGLAAVGVALANAGLALGQRILSSRIGEGLIYRLRTSLFDHVQRQPLAFFTHTQTGALTSRLNSDVVGAQRALTGTLGSVFSNLISLVTTLVTMFLLNWRITLIAVAVLPLFLLPARRVGRRLQAITRESMQLNAAMNTTMNERFNVAGALLVMLFGRRDRELARASPTRPPGSATSGSAPPSTGRPSSWSSAWSAPSARPPSTGSGPGRCSRTSSRPVTWSPWPPWSPRSTAP